MKNYRRLQKRFIKSIAIALATSIVMQQMLMPLKSFALTSGPSSPEFSTYTPYQAGSMVNEFTGDFSYSLPVLSVPGPHGSGYSMSLNYQSGASPEQDASWVGYGWSLSPGAVMRQKRGFADDANGALVTYHNKTPKNFTLGHVCGGNFGYLSAEIDWSNSVSVNNKRGISTGSGIGLSFLGEGIDLSADHTTGDLSWSPSLSFIDPFQKGAGIIIGYAAEGIANAQNAEGNFNQDLKDPWKLEKNYDVADAGAYETGMTTALNAAIGSPGTYRVSANSFNQQSNYVPTYTGFSTQYALTLSGSYYGFSGGASYTSSYSSQTTTNEERKNAYGYLYTSEAENNENSLMDYYTENGAVNYRENEYLGAPFSNPDYFVATGMGISGGFRLYNKGIPQFRPGKSVSTTTNTQYVQSFNATINPTQWSVSSETDANLPHNTIVTVEEWEDAWDSDSQTPSLISTEDEDEAYFFRYDNDMGGRQVYATMGAGEITNDDPTEVTLMSYKRDQATLTLNEYNSNDTYEDLLSNTLSMNAVSGSFTAEQQEDEDLNKGGLEEFFKLDASDIGNQKYVSEDTYIDRVGRSGYIGYHTNMDIYNGKTFSIGNSCNEFLSRNDNNIKDGIGEIVTYNDAGAKYAYTLPVYNRNEGVLSYNVSKNEVNDSKTLAFKDISQSNTDVTTKLGWESNAPYAAEFLLTQITGADYVDRTLDGISDDDFGSWTKFNYTQKYGSVNKEDENSEWYKWRSPYIGLAYQEGSMFDPTDDLGSASYGEKEVYYLKSIETQTHIAKFIVSEREDALGAYDNATAANHNDYPNRNDVAKSYKLDKIELYVKGKDGADDQLLQTVHLAYAYECWPMSTNSLSSNHGRLTLKKVWTEYENIHNATIYPYEFEYKYKDESYFPNHIWDMYSNIVDYAENRGPLGEDLDETPNYDVANTDVWGNYRARGSERQEQRAGWIDQTPDYEFDPAAWMLKCIKLPTGGELLIQYEQDDYSCVQDYPAFVMVPLKDIDNTVTQDERLAEGENGKYYLNTEDIGYSESELEELKNYLGEYFLMKHSYKYNDAIEEAEAYDGYNYTNSIDQTQSRNYIYANFLYTLLGEEDAALDEHSSEYISGYVNVVPGGIGVDENGLYITLGTAATGDLGLAADDYNKTLRELCLDYVSANRYGLFQESGSINNDPYYTWRDVDDVSLVSGGGTFSDYVVNSATIVNEINDELGLFGTYLMDLGAPIAAPSTLFSTVTDNNGRDFNAITSPYQFDTYQEDYCTNINIENSYVRIPVNKGKLGGGVRVKRLLTYDAGMAENENQAVLYGAEYEYTTTADHMGETFVDIATGVTKSSGVATSEPQGLNNESALVQQIDPVNLEYNYIFEGSIPMRFGAMQSGSGPIVGSQMPGASVGYSRVVVKNIYNAENNPGFAVKEFYTAFDYPTVVKATQMQYGDFNPTNWVNLASELQNTLAFQWIEEIQDLWQVLTSLLFDDRDSLQEWRDDIEARHGEDSEFADLIVAIDNAIQNEDDQRWSNLLDAIKTAIATLIDNALMNNTENNSVNNTYVSQGYSIYKNNMHGQAKSISTYAGNYENVSDLINCDLSTIQSFTYYELGEPVALFDGEIDDDLSYDPEYSNDTRNIDPCASISSTCNPSNTIGKTVEWVVEAKSTKIETNEVVNTVGTVRSVIASIRDFIGSSASPSISKTHTIKTRQEMYSMVNTKIVNYPAILKSVDTYQAGVTTKTDFLAFDPITGKNVVSRTYDEYNNGYYTSYSLPASMNYNQTGPKYYNQGYAFTADLIRASTIDEAVFYVKDDSKEAMLHKGDLLFVNWNGSSTHNGYWYVTTTAVGTDGTIIVKIQYASDTMFSCASSGTNSKIEIVESGYTNQLSTVVGNIVTYNTNSNELQPCADGDGTDGEEEDDDSNSNSDSDETTTIPPDESTTIPYDEIVVVDGTTYPSGDIIGSIDYSYGGYSFSEESVGATLGSNISVLANMNLSSNYQLICVNEIAHLGSFLTGNNGSEMFLAEYMKSAAQNATLIKDQVHFLETFYEYKCKGMSNSPISLNDFKQLVFTYVREQNPNSFLNNIGSRTLKDHDTSALNDLVAELNTAMLNSTALKAYYNGTESIIILGQDGKVMEDEGSILGDRDNYSKLSLQTQTGSNTVLTVTKNNRSKKYELPSGGNFVIKNAELAYSNNLATSNNTASNSDDKGDTNINTNNDLMAKDPLADPAMYNWKAMDNIDEKLATELSTVAGFKTYYQEHYVVSPQLNEVGVDNILKEYMIFAQQNANIITDQLLFANAYYNYKLSTQPGITYSVDDVKSIIGVYAKEYNVQSLLNTIAVGKNFLSYTNDSNEKEVTDNSDVTTTTDSDVVIEEDETTEIEYNPVHIISATAVSISNNWPQTDAVKDVYDITSINPYLTAEKGKYRAVSSYVYNDAVVNGSDYAAGERVYAAGYTTGFYEFNYSTDVSNTEQSSLWKKTKTMEQYSPHGEPLEEKDILDVYSCAKFGYDQALPTLSAVNSTSNSVMFEGFENIYDTYIPGYIHYYRFEDDYAVSGFELNVSDLYKHSGKQSLYFSVPESGSYTFPLNDLKLSPQLLLNGLQVKFWTKLENETNVDIKLTEASSKFADVAFHKVARVEDWVLYEAQVKNWGSSVSLDEFMPQIVFTSLNSYPQEVYVDDVRMQPLDAEMKCFVYDNANFRLLASFDDQHFGTYYQYNAEGQLIRKLLETEKGKLMAVETHYNVPGQRRHSASGASELVDGGENDESENTGKNVSKNDDENAEQITFVAAAASTMTFLANSDNIVFNLGAVNYLNKSQLTVLEVEHTKIAELLVPMVDEGIYNEETVRQLNEMMAVMVASCIIWESTDHTESINQQAFVTALYNEVASRNQDDFATSVSVEQFNQLVNTYKVSNNQSVFNTILN